MYEIGTALNVGIKRKDKANQDYLAIIEPRKLGIFGRKPPLLVVADGMGGYKGGEIASHIVVDTMAETYRKARISDGNYTEMLRQAILNSHEAMRQESEKDPERAQMGSTVVAVVLDHQRLHLANVGDSHAYLINPREIRLINFDHSLVAEQIRLGLITQAEAANHPRRNVLTLSISAQRDVLEPYLATIDLQVDDTVLLCSDGLWGTVPEPQIQQVVLGLPPQQAADRLVEIANGNHGPDNISIIIARQKK